MKSCVAFMGAVLVVVSVIRLDAGQAAEKLSVETLPPVVVKTVPPSGRTRVDAAKTKELRITFSKKMMDGNWSFVQVSQDTMPKTAGKIRYKKDGKTCVLPVDLEPGRTYALWINSQKFGNFKDRAKRSAVPYLLVFETKPVK